MLRGRAKGVEEPAGTEAPTWVDEVQSIPIRLIKANPYQPRQEFAANGLAELAASIKEHGILHPIIVRKGGLGFELVVGERRLRACRDLGWENIPAIVRDLSEKAAAEMALIENLQRRDLAFFEEAEGYRNLIEEFGLTQDELAKRLGRSQSSVANKMRLLRLPMEVRQIISREMLSERHARALLRLEDEEAQKQAAEYIIANELNVKDTEKLVESLNIKAKGKKQNKAKSLAATTISNDFSKISKSLKKLTKSLESSGLSVHMEEEDSPEYYTVVVQIQKPERREQ